MKPLGWIVPVGLGALMITLVVTLVFAREERPSRALSAVTPAILEAAEGTPPEIAAINAELSQLAELRSRALYGPGMTHLVRAPVPSLRAPLGEEWRELSKATGRVYIRPAGPVARYFELSMVVVPTGGPTHLQVETSVGDRVEQPVGVGPSFTLLTFGPLQAPKRGGVGIALRTLSPRGTSPGQNLVISPLQSEYRAPGEWIEVMPALQEPGPNGRRGEYLSLGSTTGVALTPGISGRCALRLEGAAVGGSLRVSATIGHETHSVDVRPHTSTFTLGTFARAGTIATLGVTALPGVKNGFLFLSGMRLVSKRS
jgi:hypothetical protein